MLRCAVQRLQRQRQLLLLSLSLLLVLAIGSIRTAAAQAPIPASVSRAAPPAAIDPQRLFSGLHKYKGCPDGITVVALVNDLYYDEAMKWKEQFMDHHSISSVHIINVAEGMKLSYHTFLVYRTRVMMSLLRDENVTCLLGADVDTYWVKNPLPFIEALANEDDYDIVASEGTVYPQEVHRVWGHVVCGGFWMFRRTYHALNVLHQVASSRLRKPDDQKLVNNYLMSYYNMSWVRAADGGRIGVGREGIKVRTIPESVVQRRAARDFDFEIGYVFHPLGDKNPNVKARLREEVLARLSAASGGRRPIDSTNG